MTTKAHLQSELKITQKISHIKVNFFSDIIFRKLNLEEKHKLGGVFFLSKIFFFFLAMKVKNVKSFHPKARIKIK